jgi:hypothetical protein
MNGSERAQRWKKSSEPVVVNAKLRLGYEMDPVQDGPPGSVPLPASARKVNQSRSLGQRADWRLNPTQKEIVIEGSGCSNSYGFFGAPGTGKTFLMRKVLRDIIRFSPNELQRFGGLILDPKGSMIDDVQTLFEKECPEELGRLVLVDGTSFQKPINVISCSMRTRELARALVLAAQSAGVQAKEPYWFLAWRNVFGAAMTLLQFHPELRELTLGRIVQALVTVNDEGRREIEVIAEQCISALDTCVSAYTAIHPGTAEQDAAEEIKRAYAELQSFYRSKPDHLATVESFIIDAYGEFMGPRCRCFSPEQPRSLGRVTERTLYDSILEEGKIVVVSLPPSEPALAKTLCTLIKCLFQQTVMSRKRRYRDGELNNWDRVVFLACDEYSEIASEVPGQPMGDGRFFALARENGCLGLLATQSVHVLENSSLGESWKSIFSNFAAKVFMGAADVDTARQATELAGKFDWQMRTQTTGLSAEGPTVSIQKDLRERDQVPTYFLTQLVQRGQGIVIGSLNGRELPKGQLTAPDCVRFLEVRD